MQVVQLDDNELSLIIDLLDMDIDEADAVIGDISDDEQDVEEMLSQAGPIVDLKVDIVHLRAKLMNCLLGLPTRKT